MIGFYEYIMTEEGKGPALSTVKPRTKEVLKDELTIPYENCIDDEPPSDLLNQLHLENPMEGVYYIDNVLTEGECKKLCEATDASASLSFWCAGKETDPETRSFRNAETIELYSHTFADKIWKRVKHLITEELLVTIPDDEEHVDHQRELVGDWLPCGMNPDNLLVRYPHYGSFAPHTDGRAIVDFNHRSHYTALLYLNTVPIDQGAGTRIYDKSAVTKLERKTINDTEYWTADESLILSSIQAVTGRLLIFYQPLVHEGIPPIAPYMKYIIRSDVIFERTPMVCHSEKDQEAYRIFRQAESLAENDEVDAAVPLFKRAFKMSPEMARIMGQG